MRVAQGLCQLRNSRVERGRVPPNVRVGHGESKLVPAAPAARSRRPAAAAGGTAGELKSAAEGGRTVLSVQKQDRIGHQSIAGGHLEREILRHSAALLGLGQRGSLLIGVEGGDRGGECALALLVAVVIPAEDGGKPAGLERLGDEHCVAVATVDGGRPCGVGDGCVLGVFHGLVEGVDSGVVPGLVSVH